MASELAPVKERVEAAQRWKSVGKLLSDVHALDGQEGPLDSLLLPDAVKVFRRLASAPSHPKNELLCSELEALAHRVLEAARHAPNRTVQYELGRSYAELELFKETFFPKLYRSPATKEGLARRAALAEPVPVEKSFFDVVQDFMCGECDDWPAKLNFLKLHYSDYADYRYPDEMARIYAMTSALDRGFASRVSRAIRWDSSGHPFALGRLREEVLRPFMTMVDLHLDIDEVPHVRGLLTDRLRAHVKVGV